MMKPQIKKNSMNLFECKDEPLFNGWEYCVMFFFLSYPISVAIGVCIGGLEGALEPTLVSMLAFLALSLVFSGVFWCCQIVRIMKIRKEWKRICERNSSGNE